MIVDSAPRGRQPTWGGYLTPEAAKILHEERTEMQGVLKPGHDGIEVSDGQVQWWTFAGGRINSTLRYAISASEPGWSFIPDNFSITVRGETLNIERFLAAKQQLASPEFWHNTEFWRSVAASLPNYRLSKFQPLMPSWVEREVLAAYLLNVPGACRWLSATNKSTDGSFPTQ